MVKEKFDAKKEIENIKAIAETNESYFIGLMWHNPFENFALYGNYLTGDDFLHKNWGFFFDLGNRLYKKGLHKFDDISVNATVLELGIKADFDKYGGLDVLYELIEIVKENADNIEAYFDLIVRNKVIVSLMGLLGKKVLEPVGSYRYDEMDASQITAYWQYQMNNIALEGIANYETENLYVDGEQFLKDAEEKSKEMLPFYNSHILNRNVKGFPRGEVTMFGGFGNSGKSSFMVDKVLMACIHDEYKTLVVLNEEGADKLREKVLLSLINHEMEERFPRSRLANVSNMTEEHREIVKKGFKRLHELFDGDESKIKIVFMEQYKIEDLRNIVALHANQGFVNVIIDTHKVPDQYRASSRWEAIVEATKEIYKFTRPDAGGFNLRTFLTIQLADAHISSKFLSYDAIGEGKAMKNEASILMMYRPLFSDEYDKLKVHKNVQSNLSPNGWIKEEIHLDRDKTYYVMFFPKNRFGGNTDSGSLCLVYDVNFEFNSFREIGEVKIDRAFDRRS